MIEKRGTPCFWLGGPFRACRSRGGVEGMADSRRHLAIILAGLLLLSGLGLYACLPPGGTEAESRDPGSAGTGAPAGAETVPPLPGGNRTVLVMGVDERPGDAGRADTMMVLSWDPGSDRLAVLSIPRDLWVQIPGYGYDKVSHSFPYGGEKLAVVTVQRLLGLSIDHYLVINFQGFRKIVDALGGVEIDVEKRLYYEDPYDVDGGLVIDLHPGLQRLDGKKALDYARFRMDEEGDLGRIRRQQLLVRELAREALRPANFARVPSLVRSLAGAVRTDLGVSDMVRIGMQARNALKSPVQTGSIAGEGGSLRDVFYLLPNVEEIRLTAFQLLSGGEPDAGFLARAREAQAGHLSAWQSAVLSVRPAPAGNDPATGEAADGEGSSEEESADPESMADSDRLTVAIIDASGGTLAHLYAVKLEKAGFHVSRVTSSARIVEQTVIFDRSGSAASVEQLRGIFPSAVIDSPQDGAAEETFEVVLGADLR
jgi:polyisoprenyl-teichoic acid--peptidoglycan teichoic acid transferase